MRLKFTVSESVSEERGGVSRAHYHLKWHARKQLALLVIAFLYSAKGCYIEYKYELFFSFTFVAVSKNRLHIAIHYSLHNLYSPLERVSENEWTNMDTECTKRAAAFRSLCLLIQLAFWRPPLWRRRNSINGSLTVHYGFTLSVHWLYTSIFVH